MLFNSVCRTSNLDEIPVDQEEFAGPKIHAWITLPSEAPESDPWFEHHSVDQIPKVKIGDATISVVLGAIYGKSSPVKGHDSTLWLVCELSESSEFNLPTTYAELAVYVVSGCLEIDRDAYAEGSMAVAAQGWPVRIRARVPSRVVVIGGMTAVGSEVDQGNGQP